MPPLLELVLGPLLLAVNPTEPGDACRRVTFDRYRDGSWSWELRIGRRILGVYR